MKHYHITTREAYEKTFSTGEYTAPSLYTEKFIHMSDRHQVIATYERFYAGQNNLMILEITPKLEDNVIYEQASDANQQMFAHFYGVIPTDRITNTIVIEDIVDWKKYFILYNVAFQLVPLKEANESYGLIDEVIEIICKDFKSAKVSAFNTTIECTMDEAVGLLYKINTYLLTLDKHLEWLCNMQIHASNYTDILEASKGVNKYNT